MYPMESYPTWSASVTLAAADATKTLLAAVAARTHALVHIVATVKTAAAQEVVVACGTTTILRIPASASGQFRVGPLNRGLLGSAKNTAIIATPTAAGPEIDFVIEGYDF